jgi:hypothetical protein
LTVATGLTVSTTLLVAVPQVALTEFSSIVTVPTPVTLTAVLALFGLPMDALAVPVVPCTLHEGVPLVTDPARLKTVGPGMVWHSVWAEPAVAVGFGFTVSVTLLDAVPQLALVEVSFNVTVPVLPLAMLTAVEAVDGLAMFTSACAIVPVELTKLHEGVPPVTDPVRLKFVVPLAAAHSV